MPQPKQKAQKPKPKGKSPEVAPDRKARWGNSDNFTFTPYDPSNATQKPNPPTDCDP
jgi:hypothetical protein